uniref:Uncharacterized protein n=1 Tax=viral metagenome TaxID=1070528 RepID=A0A6C0EF76_9ZZZZ
MIESNDIINKLKLEIEELKSKNLIIESLLQRGLF